ncbi:hypothetical protein V3C10_18970 [[Clostridium] symbiosum]|uniref:hypothetical protein n=1 Tax=Clostridium symbiosum TaxID=1512 RepID=UPI001D06CA70|nr:hypothetical protein [[Clostridium] symbiosum]MCB6610728.1 hypothetical protein [[Clostridium] symbiosum]MCB6930276.1 hypothetical protein [[Clostridium] symbiosum]
MIEYKKASKINRRINIIIKIVLWLLVLLSLLYRIFIEAGAEQKDYLNNHSLLKNEAQFQGKITGFYNGSHLVHGYRFYYSNVEYEEDGRIKNATVVRAYQDFVGKSISIKKLPKGRIIRSHFVISYRFVKMSLFHIGVIMLVFLYLGFFYYRNRK